MATFVTVANAGDIPEGELAAFEVNGVRIALTQTGGTYYAFGDICTHQQCSLAGREAARDLVGEVHVTRRINKV